eukprot:GEMP01015560.1.p1 GENE.GEMP01015560.1~~GEMP01015560.1.p1  ORF type:complete len:369 (+),score=68.89 GEMP01015560.1:197-1303(+)
MLPLTTCMDEEMPIISLPVRRICVSLCMDSSQHSGAMGRSSSSESTDAQKELMVSFSPGTPGSQSDISYCQQEPTDRPSIVLNKRVSVKFDAPRSKRLISMTRPKREVNTLIVGLDNAGKTTLLYLLANGAKIPTLPTMGYNQEVLKYDTCALTTRDVSGLHNIRHTWPAHYDGVRALIFVVDATDRARLPEAREELTKVLRHFASVNPGSRDRDPSVRPKEVVSQATMESIAEFGAVPTSESFTMGTGVSKSSGMTSVPMKKKRKSWAARALHKLTHRTTGNNEDPKKRVLVHEGGEQPSGVPVLIVASKQDKRRAMSAQTLVEEMCLLDMPELADVDWAVVETDYTRVKSPIPGMKWLCKALNERN